MMAKIRYAEALRQALVQEMRRDPTVVFYGEDVGTYGGVFKVSRDLQAEFGHERVRDTPISEHTMTGMTVGAAMCGLRPVVEIMYADFLGLTMDTLVNQASIAYAVWNRQFSVPMVLRTQGGAGAGAGAQHSKSLEAWIAHVPGLKVVSPATPADAKGLLAAAIRDPNPVIVLEHKFLYNNSGEVPEDDYIVEIGRAAVVRPGNDVTIVANSRMVLESLAAAERLSSQGIDAEVIDLRTLRPLDRDTVVASVRRTGRAVVVNEGWRFCGYGAELSATIAEEAFEYLDAPVMRVSALDMPIPFSEPLELATLPNVDRIVAAAREATL